jgi:hypothetical protein
MKPVPRSVSIVMRSTLQPRHVPGITTGAAARRRHHSQPARIAIATINAETAEIAEKDFGLRVPRVLRLTS